MSCDDEVAIRVSAVSKIYPVFARREDRLRQLLLGWAHHYYTPFYALENISFDVAKGESFGIIGRNGSGKSTLLQIIAGTLAPTSGVVQTNGRVAALLELGTGFNPEFTGRENVFLNAAILGFSRAEAEARFDEIAAFAEIGEFLDQPVKQYSSGMFMRLAFAVQATLASDIIIVDEALAVGDVFFRQKCYRRLARLRDDGATVVLVSHSMGEIEQHCQRAAVLDHGHLSLLSESPRAIKHYYLLEQRERLGGAGLRPAAEQTASAPVTEIPAPPPESCFSLDAVEQFNAFGASCVMVALTDANNEARRVFRSGETAVFTHDYILTQDTRGLFAGVVMHAETGAIVHGKNSLQAGEAPLAFAAAGSRVRVRQEFTLDLAAGEYTFEVGLASVPDASAVSHMTLAEFDHTRIRLVQAPRAGAFQVIFLSQRGVEALPHYGLANLQSRVSLAVLGPEDTSAAAPQLMESD